MPTLADLIAALATSVADLLVVFVTEVALRDPLAFISFLVGAVLTTAAVAAMGYLAAGAAAELVGVSLPSPGRTRRRSGR